MSIKNIIKSIIGQELINKVRGNKARKEEIVVPEEDRTEVELRKAFYAQFINPGDICFDVGANTGNRITPILELKAKVIAIEPQKSCQAILKKKFGNRITLVRNGLSEKEEYKEFYIADASTISSFSTEWIESVKKDRFKDHKWNTVQKIKMTTLDNLIEKYGMPKFIKIDVEGYELEVLKGLHSSVPYLSYEYTTPEQTEKAIACMDYLSALNPGILCNYSIGESMHLEMEKWVNRDQMFAIINTPEFIASGFGDIYIMG